MTGVPFDLQLLNLCAALLLLLSFAMLTQRRIVNLVNLLAVQGTVLFIATLLIAFRTHQAHLYLSAALTLGLKVVLLAENARIPVDNPATHLELTMIHEAMMLEYSARHLALMEWAAALKLFNYACIGFALFIPWGLSTRESAPVALLASIPVLAAKLAVAGALLAVLETVSAKLRVFRAPEFLATAFLFAVLGLLVHLLLRV